MSIHTDVTVNGLRRDEIPQVHVPTQRRVQRLIACCYARMATATSAQLVGDWIEKS